MDIPRNRQGFALPEYLAYASIERAIRPYARSDRFAVALVLPRWEDKAIYLRAAAAHLNPLDNFRVSDRAYIGDEKPETYDSILDDFANRRTIVLFKDGESVPQEVAIAFDSVTHLDVPSIRMVQGIVKWIYKLEIGSEDAELLARSDWRHLKLAVVRGRPISRVLSSLRKLQAAPLSASVKRTIIDETISLERMEGYGEAKNWGLDLARDVGDWSTGSLSWDDVDRGILLSGPPGVGKTVFARALARTCKMALVVASYAKWQAKGHLGDFLKAMQGSFGEARKMTPSILFIDELDAFGDRNTVDSDNASYDIKAINGLLEQLDGLEGREGVVVVGACNNPGWIDPAITRPGRLDRQVRIGLPDADARAAIFRMHLREELSAKDHRAFAAATEGMTGADIQQIVRYARRNARRGRHPLTPADVFRHVPPAVPVPPDVIRINAIHEIGHAIVGAALGMSLSTVSIASTLRLDQTRQHVGQAVFARNVWARRTKDHYLDIIAMTMGGIAAEHVFLGCWDDGASGGAGSDLHEATKIAIALERSYGMGKNLASYGPASSLDTNEIRQVDSSLMAEVEVILRDQFDRAKAILEDRRDACLELVDKLVRRQLLPGSEVMEAICQISSVPEKHND
ncbi:ATP-dependent Zn protease [Rhizobium leguminosarum bv. trifolii WSM2297]|uniref:ATP-dependent Zn protease n=1 Tax=Rhizobium leguminosarum bv. trifolii WSM2297 TaxID=754762 RepID=J0CAP5_RHILT|nr:AAA family ATPase [Rhizobium leguminosarum]EJC80177.1 ATP-dependent Zn protease [Rhizobium leguminosarum bv. trifolii WSM2297]